MTKLINAQISASRKILGNPYAYLDGEGGYDAILFQGAPDVRESRRLMGNQYAYTRTWIPTEGLANILVPIMQTNWFRQRLTRITF